MEEKSQLWFGFSPFIQVSFWFKQGEEREKKRKKRRNQGMENFLGLCMEPICMEPIGMELWYGNYHKPYLFMGC